MEIYLGESGLENSWQEHFEKTTKCKCGNEARIMFVGFEDNEKEYVCQLKLKPKLKNDEYWLHDACAVAVYLCPKCFEATAIVNQA